MRNTGTSYALRVNKLVLRVFGIRIEVTGEIEVVVSSVDAGVRRSTWSEEATAAPRPPAVPHR